MTTTTPATAIATTVTPSPAPPAPCGPLARAGDAAVTTLLNCYLRETGAEIGGGGRLRLELLGLELLAPPAYRSPTGQHRWRLPVRLVGAPHAAPVPLDHVTLATLLGKELSLAQGDGGGADLGELVAAVAESTANVARFLAAGATAGELEPMGPQPATPFIAAEQSLAFGHPLHPTPKSRPQLSPGEVARYSHLGPQGAPWWPTSSLRTVYRADLPVMLKLSLWVRITNSVRANLTRELARGVEVHRLLEAGLGAELAARFPRFAIVRDPAWVTVRRPGDAAESGFEVVLRDNPYPAGSASDATVVAALGAEPRAGGPSRLASTVLELARASGRRRDEVARDWFRRYLEVVADPLLWLYAERGVALEAHQQNVILELDGGWPAGCRYRDNQGYYFKASSSDALRRLLPELNRASDTVCDDHVADERFGYYLGVNNLLGVVGALGGAGLADERDLLADLGAYLRSAPDSPLARTLLAARRLRCKANLRTRLAGMDELVGPLATQSVYVEVDNPLLAAGRPA